jgi:hypothetical protein
MENPTPFDLKEAICRWQENFGASPAFKADNLEELAAHLRASIEKLKATGLSEEEAFRTAARRIGERGPLAGEYAKVNSPVAWSHTVFVFWLVAGMFVMQVAFSLVTGVLYLHFRVRFGAWLRHGPDSVVQMYGWFNPSVYMSPQFQLNGVILLVMVFIICARLAFGEWKRFNMFIRCFEHPFRTALCLTALGLFSTTLPALTSPFLNGFPYSSARLEAHSLFRLGYAVEATLVVVWVLTMVFLARRALRNNAAGQRAAQ